MTDSHKIYHLESLWHAIYLESLGHAVVVQFKFRGRWTKKPSDSWPSWGDAELWRVKP